ncbi:unnamed protein product [Lasius platythorax]|uniref:Uncharacterized protein n=1 Tax=Lasius platythorax TaxID=488582 RepID=A0AAV2NXC4_9HYME
MESQRAIRAFLLWMVIQLHCEILLAENDSNSRSDIIGILPEKSKYSLKSEDDLEEYPDYNTQYLDDDEYTADLEQLSRRAQYSDSDPHVTKETARRSQSLDSKYTADLRQLLSRRAQYSDSDPHVTKVPARRSQSLDSKYTADLGQLSRRAQYSDSDPHVTKVPARRSQSLDSKYTADLGQLSRRAQYSDSDPHVTKVPARRSQSLDSKYTADLGQLSRRAQYSDSDLHVTKVPARRSQSSDSRRAQYSDSDPHVTKVAARRSQSSDSEYTANSRQLSSRRTQYLDSNSRKLQIPTKKPKYSHNEHPDDSNHSEQYSDPSSLEEFSRRSQSQRRDLEISPRLNSKHSDIEHTIDLRQPLDYETRYVLPEAAPVTGQVSSRKLQAARRSSKPKPSLRTFPDSNSVQQSNTRRSLSPTIKLAKMGFDLNGVALLPQVFLGEAGNPQRTYYEEAHTIACPEGTHLVANRCEPIFYVKNNGAKIKKIVRQSDIYIDDNENNYEI